MQNQVEILKFKKGEIIIREGERSDCAYILESGMAEVSKSLPNGEQQFVGIMFPGVASVIPLRGMRGIQPLPSCPERVKAND